MSEQFKVGDVVELCNLVDDCSHMNGAEATIVDGPGMYGPVDGKTHYGYLIDCSEERNWFVFPHEMRKKRPPTKYEGEQSVMDLFTNPPVVQPELEPA